MNSEQETPILAAAGDGLTGNSRNDRLELARLEFALRDFSAAKREGGNLSWLAGDDRALAAGIHCLQVWAEIARGETTAAP